jgi:DNA polymerase III alpha subunit
MPAIYKAKIYQSVEETHKFFGEFSRFLKDNIEKRFCSELKYGYIGILNVDILRNLSESEISSYGIVEMDYLINYYGYEQINTIGDTFAPIINATKTRGEWQIFKRWVRIDCLQLNQGQLISYIHKNCVDKFENIMKLLILGEIIPMSTACCERGFSEITNTKTELRSLLGEI